MNATVEADALVPQPSTTKTIFGRFKSLWQADFLSPKDLVRRALLLTLLYALVTAFGLREFTSVLNGTMGSVSLGWQMSAFLGLLYIASYLAFILGMPTLLLAAAMLLLWRRLLK